MSTLSARIKDLETTLINIEYHAMKRCHCVERFKGKADEKCREAIMKFSRNAFDQELNGKGVC